MYLAGSCRSLATWYAWWRSERTKPSRREYEEDGAGSDGCDGVGRGGGGGASRGGCDRRSARRRGRRAHLAVERLQDLGQSGLDRRSRCHLLARVPADRHPRGGWLQSDERKGRRDASPQDEDLWWRGR